MELSGACKDITEVAGSREHRVACSGHNAGGLGSDKALFKPFRTAKQGGTELRLVITRKLLAAMHGTICIGMLEGGGVRATIVLPRPLDAQIACCAEGGGGLS